MTAADFLLLIAFIVVAVCLGKPISFLNCYAVQSTSESVTASNAYTYYQSVKANLNISGAGLNLAAFAGATKANCFETKALWGLSIALW